ncbi:hypothetical protein BASA81_007794 [Batrachochytrium salamandrivorans]|nr:hypothetical protein BASA81_007794 [Batrachochytrium salamandrivorans]
MSRLNTVKSEIHNVLSTVRLAERSSQVVGYDNGEEEEDEDYFLRNVDSLFVQRLKYLHEYLLTFDSLEEVDCSVFLDPFLLVIRDHSSAVVVGVALSAVNKLLLYGVISSASCRNVKQGVNASVEAVCHLLASNKKLDEVGQLQAVEVLISLLRSGEDGQVSDLNVWKIVTECFEMATSRRHSELLRAYAANQLGHVTLFVFVTRPAKLNLQVKLLKFLIKLTRQKLHTILGLQLVNICLETGVTNPELAPVLQNELFDSLLENSQTLNLAVFSLVLRVVYNLFSSTGSGLNLKIQLEIFLTSVHFHCLETNNNMERRELALESLLDFCHDRVLVLNLFANFDCDVKSSNLFERLCKLLFQFATCGTKGEVNKLNLSALEGLFSIASRLESRCGLNSLPPELLDEEEAWIRKHSHKRQLVQCANSFNSRAPDWVDFSRELGYDDVDQFLFSASNLLDKQVLGDYLSDNIPVLQRYLANHFDMRGKRVDEALREVLSCFRIPGEAQKIDRVVESIASRYFDTSNDPKVFATADAVFIFAFSIIMLHTDRHSRSINPQDRMTLDQFVRNVRGINNGEDFPKPFLQQVFDSVSEREFILTAATTTTTVTRGGTPSPSPEVANGVAVAAASSEFVHHVNLDVPGGPQERRMFEILFDSMLQVVDQALPIANPRLGFRLLCCCAHLATVAQYYDMSEAFNLVLITLCKHFFQLVPITLELFDKGEMKVEEEEESLVVAKSIIKIALRNENCVREAWANICLMLSVLLHHGFLPELGNDSRAQADEHELREFAAQLPGKVYAPLQPSPSLWGSVASFFVGGSGSSDGNEALLEEHRAVLQRESLKLALRKTYRKYFALEFTDLLYKMQHLEDSHSQAHLANAIWSPFCAADKPFAWSKRSESEQLLPSLLHVLFNLQSAVFLFPGVADECFECAISTGVEGAFELYLGLNQPLALPKTWNALIKTAKVSTLVLAQVLETCDGNGLDNQHWLELVSQLDPCESVLELVSNRTQHITSQDELVQVLEVLNRYLETPSPPRLAVGRVLQCFRKFDLLTLSDSCWLLVLSTLKCYWDGVGNVGVVGAGEVFAELILSTTNTPQRGELALEKLLFPLVVQTAASPARRVQAQLVLGRLFLLLLSWDDTKTEEGGGLVEKYWAQTAEYLVLGVRELGGGDEREKVVQMILNVVNVVGKVDAVEARLDLELHQGWREQGL